MALKVFHEMRTEKCKPNICTYTALINAYAREGLCEKAEEVFEEMQGAGHEPDVYAYNALIEAYRYKHFKEIWVVNELLMAMAKIPKLAIVSVVQVFRMDPLRFSR